MPDELPPRRRPGRPALSPGDSSTQVNLTMPSRDYQRAAAIARRDGVSIPAVLRRAFRRAVGLPETSPL